MRSTARSGSCEGRDAGMRNSRLVPRTRRTSTRIKPLMPVRVADAGLGYWGPNLVRNFDDLGELAWLVDLDPQLLERFGARYPSARTTADLNDVLADGSVDAVVVATPVPTHYALAKRALEAGKHVLVEKPPAMRAAEMDELVA